MTTFVIIAVVALAIAGIALFQLFRERAKTAKTAPGFREFVKNPHLWNKMIEANEKAASTAAEAAHLDEVQLVEVVERYVFNPKTNRDLWAIGRQLSELSPKTNDALLKILRDKTNEGRLAKLRPAEFLEEAPVMRVCELFDGNMPAAAIELLSPYLSHESSQIRKECILAVAESGLPEALPAIKRALADEDEYVRSYALIGMMRALKNDKLSNEISSEVVTDLDHLVEKDLNVKNAALLMAQLDPMHAEAFLLSDAILNSEKWSLHDVLRVVGQFDFKIRRETVKSLVETYADREMTYPSKYVMGESLALLGNFREPHDEDTLEHFSKHDEDRVSDGAARGLLSFHNLRGFKERVWEKEQTGGWESLNKEQQMYVAVFWLDSEVSNGGHSQYFFNSAGDNWQIALDGLNAMGFKERLEIFEGVLKLFGDQKPLTDRGRRHDQLAAVYSKHEAAFDEFDSAYHKANESVEVISTRFVFQNADKFK